MAAAQPPGRSGRQPPADADEQLFCEICLGHFDCRQLREVERRVVCRGCHKGSHRRPAAGPVPDRVRAIIAVNPWILLAYVTGLLAVGVPVQIWAVTRLLKAIGCRPRWPWVAAAAVPLCGTDTTRQA